MPEDRKLSQETAAAALTGAELAYVVQGGNSRRTTTQAIADLAADTDLSYTQSTRVLASSTGADVTLPLATDSLPGLMAVADKLRIDQLGADDSPIFAGLTITGTAAVSIPHIHGDLAGAVYIHVKNTSAGTLAKGTPVYATGTVGDTTTLEVAGADSSSASFLPAIGLLADALAPNASGHAVIAGELTGLNTGAYAIGDALYVASGGGLTATRPTTGTIQQVAIVGRVNASTGSVTVTIAGMQSPNWDTNTGDVTLAASVADVLSLSGQELQADDPGGDRILFWDDSEGRLRHLSLGTNLAITGTVLDATGGGSGTKTLARFTAREGHPPATNFATIDERNSIRVLEFDAATEESIAFMDIIPEGANLTSGLLVRIWWMADTATSGNVRWAASFERSGTDLDADSFDTATEVTSAASGTSGIETVAEITCTAIDSLAAGERFRLRIARKAADAVNDTMSGDAQIVAVEVRGVA